MKYINISKEWELVSEPMVALRCHLWFGQNKHDTRTIPLVGNVPVIMRPKYILSDNRYVLSETSTVPGLSDNGFTVSKNQSGTFFITEGNDNTARCLLMVGREGGFRGDVALQETNGIIIDSCYACNACESRLEVAVVLPVGGSISFRHTGRRESGVTEFIWDGGDEIVRREYTLREYKIRSVDPSTLERI